eukprot:s29_g12.t1
MGVCRQEVAMADRVGRYRSGSDSPRGDGRVQQSSCPRVFFILMGRWRKPAKSEKSVEPLPERRPSHREAAQWSARFSIDAAIAVVTISMSKTGLTDEDLERWCVWVRGHLATQRHSCALGVVDFAENRLTAKGVRHLLETFLDLQLPVQVLKLHHNRIAEGWCFAAYLQRGWLHELHLSHNELDAQASAAIIEAAVQASDASKKIYPRRVGKGNSAPLWVRLEQNYIDPNVFSSILDAKFGDSAGICCDARSKWCTPHNCVQQAAFAVHLKNLCQQRRRGSGERTASATGSTTHKADGTECAHVLCFDWERGAWVPETIEIPAIDPAATTELSEGLKVLIGAGMKRTTASEGPSDMQALSHEEGQTMGADLLRSIRTKTAAARPATPPTVTAPKAPPLPAPAPVAPVPPLPAPVAVPPPAVAAAQAVAAQAMAKQVAAQAAWAANAAANHAAAQAAQVHCARLAAAQMAAQAARLDPRFVEDPNAWLRIEAPVFQPGARCFFATSEATGSGETSAGASDDTESLEVTAAVSTEGPETEPGLLNTDSPPSTRRRSEDQTSPAVWLSKAAPLLEELPETSLWKKDAPRAEPERTVASKNAKVAASPSPWSASVTASKPAGVSNLNSEQTRPQKSASMNSPAQWLSEKPKEEPVEPSEPPVALESSAVLSAPPHVSPEPVQEKMDSIEPGLPKSSPAIAVQKTTEFSADAVPPEIEKPLVVHEEIPEVTVEEHHEAPTEDSPELGAPEEGYEATPEVKVEGLAAEAEQLADIQKAAEIPEAAIDPTIEAATVQPVQPVDPVEPEESAVVEAKLPIDSAEMKETADFQARARVHQVFNILDEEHRTRSRSDSSPRVLDIWKKTPDTPNSTESPKQGQCHIM